MKPQRDIELINDSGGAPLTPEGGGKKKRKVNAPHYKKLWQESEAKINSIQNRTIWFIMWLTLALVVMFGSIAIAFVLNK